MSATTESPTTSTRSYLGPLTTTWIPPKQCTVFGPGGNNVSASNFYLGQDCLAGVPRDVTTCWPPALVTRSFPSILNGYGYYSPGLLCPSGYTSACAQDLSNSKLTGSLASLKNFEFQFAPIDGETAVGCCPTGMACAKPFSGYQTCVSASVSRGAAFEIGLCGSQDTYTKSQKLTIGKSASGLYGPLVQLVYKATDTSSVASTTSAAGTTTSASVPNFATSSSPSPDTSNSSGGLSSGAKIGIGVGVPLGLLLLAALAFLLFRRRRKRHTSAPAEMTYAPPNEGKNLMGIGNQSPQPHKELPTPDQNAELDGTPARTVHELSAEASPR